MRATRRPPLGTTDAPARTGRRAGDARHRPPRLPAPAPPDDDADAPPTTTPAPARIPAVERRRGVEILLGLWADVARDLVLVGTGGARSVHDTVLLDELAAISAAIAPGSAARVPGDARRGRPSCSPANVSPELVLDALVLAWPSRSAAA